MKLTEEEKTILGKLRACCNKYLDIFGKKTEFDNVVLDLLSEENVEKMLNDKNQELDSSFQKDEKHYM
jgi:hypothetical protein